MFRHEDVSTNPTVEGLDIPQQEDEGTSETASIFVIEFADNRRRVAKWEDR